MWAPVLFFDGPTVFLAVPQLAAEASSSSQPLWSSLLSYLFLDALRTLAGVIFPAALEARGTSSVATSDHPTLSPLLLLFGASALCIPDHLGCSCK